MSISQILYDTILNDMDKHLDELDYILNVYSYLQNCNDEILFTDSLCKMLLKNRLLYIQDRHLRSYIIKQKDIKLIKRYYKELGCEQVSPIHYLECSNFYETSKCIKIIQELQKEFEVKRIFTHQLPTPVTLNYRYWLLKNKLVSFERYNFGIFDRIKALSFSFCWGFLIFLPHRNRNISDWKDTYIELMKHFRLSTVKRNHWLSNTLYLLYYTLKKDTHSVMLFPILCGIHELFFKQQFSTVHGVGILIGLFISQNLKRLSE